MALGVIQYWIQEDPMVSKKLAHIAGDEPSELVRVQFLNVYLSLGLLKDKA